MAHGRLTQAGFGANRLKPAGSFAAGFSTHRFFVPHFERLVLGHGDADTRFYRLRWLCVLLRGNEIGWRDTRLAKAQDPTTNGRQIYLLTDFSLRESAFFRGGFSGKVIYYS